MSTHGSRHYSSVHIFSTQIERNIVHKKEEGNMIFYDSKTLCRSDVADVIVPSL